MKRSHIKVTQTSIKIKVMKMISHELSFLHKNILKVVSMGVHSKDVKKQKSVFLQKN